MAHPNRRAQLEGWIADSRRLQSRMSLGFGVAAAAALGALWIDPFIGKLSLAIIVVTAICAYWVTGSHITDWRHQLALLDSADKASKGKR